jgi:hypothetical protein
MSSDARDESEWQTLRKRIDTPVGRSSAGP